MFWKKNFLLFAFITLLVGQAFAQTTDIFDASWRKVAGFEKKGLTKSALKEVLNIYNTAVRRKDYAQQVKSSIYQVKYRQLIEEDSRENNIFFIDTLIEKAVQPARSILQSMQAEMFWQYFQNNRFKLYNRTNVTNEKSNDISTWSAQKLHSTIAALYESSLKDAVLLQQTSLENFEPIIIKGQNTRELRPTLYDFLAHRALIYFMNDERTLVRPAYQFVLNQTEAFSPAPDFVKLKIDTQDSASLQ